MPDLTVRTGTRLRRRPATVRRTSGGVPVVLVLPALLGALFLLLPSLSLVVRAPWTDLRQILTEPDTRFALVLSLVTASLATVVSLVLGVPLAWLLARMRFRGLAVVRAAIILPLVLPPVAGGVALFAALGRTGLVGVWLLRWFDYTLPFTQTGIVVSEAFVAMPFLVVSAEGAFRTVDARLEEAAVTLGASRGTIFRRVVVPTVAPALVAGAVLSWARALGEFGATVTFNGSVPGFTQTMPIRVSQALDRSPAEAQALALLLMFIAVLVLAGLRDRWLRTPTGAA